MSINGLVQVAIGDGFEGLSKLEPGTKEYDDAVEAVTKLTNLSLEMEKLDLETAEKKEARESELNLKLKQYKSERNNRWAQIGVSVLTVLGYAGVQLWAYCDSNRIEFRDHDMMQGTAGREAFKRILSWKK